MRSDYRAWLEQQKYASNTVSTQCSLATRVEQHYGDLDEHYVRDGLRDVAQGLRYSSEDERRGRPNPSKVPINGNVYKGLASFRTAVELYRRFRSEVSHEPPAVAAERAAIVEDLGQKIGLERDLQATLRTSIEQLEPGLRVIDDGAERSVESGFIDITAKDSGGAIVVIELKAGVAGQRAIAQILSYMGDVAAEEPERSVRGVLVAAEFDAKAKAAARMAPALSLKRYGVRFQFTDC